VLRRLRARPYVCPRNTGAKLCAIRGDLRSFGQKNRSASELTRILNDECEFDEYVYLHCLQILYILYNRKLRVLNCHESRIAHNLAQA